MKYQEIIGDLFTAPEEYYLAHCISADFALGAGIAKEFDKRFDLKNKLWKKHPGYLETYDYFKSRDMPGDCILTDKILNLVTKKNYFDKPTLTSMSGALQMMSFECESSGINKIAMPTIGAGLDRLNWTEVSQLIQEVFADTDVEILVYKLK